MTSAARNRTEPQTLTEQQILAAGMVATGETGREIAEALQISEGTVSRWRQRPEFKAYVNQLLAESDECVKNRLRALSDTALNTIETVMRDRNASPADRLKAALAVLDKVSLQEIGSSNPQAIAQQQMFSTLAEQLQIDGGWGDDDA